MNYTIVGNGVAGVTAALALRERDHQSEIALIGDEHDYFFSRTALMYVYMDRMSLRDLEPHERKVYDKQRIRRVRGRVISIDAARRTLTLANRSQVSYGKLLIASGSVPNKLDCPGFDKVRSGLTNFVSLQDLQLCESLTTNKTRAVVAGGGLIGIELVECLRHHGVPVTYLVREPWYMAGKLNEVEGKIVADELRRHSVDLRVGTQVEAVETSAAGAVTAVRTSQNQALPCSFLGVAIGVSPAVQWLRDSIEGLRIGRGIEVDPAFRTSLPGVWAAGDCAEIQTQFGPSFVEQMWYSAKRQGQLAAASMAGDAVEYVRPTFYNSAKFFEVEYTAVGIMAQDAEREFCAVLPKKSVSVRINASAGCVQGFSLLGARWDHRLLTNWVEERRSLDFVLSHLSEAQFAVEFGRKNFAKWQVVHAGASAA